MNEDGHTSSIRDKILTITVKPGWKAGTKITFPREGDQGPNTIPADIVFILKDKPHPRFERVGNDLIYTATIQLGEVRPIIYYISNFTLNKIQNSHLKLSTWKIQNRAIPSCKTGRTWTWEPIVNFELYLISSIVEVFEFYVGLKELFL